MMEVIDERNQHSEIKIDATRADHLKIYKEAEQFITDDTDCVVVFIMQKMAEKGLETISLSSVRIKHLEPLHQLFHKFLEDQIKTMMLATAEGNKQ